MLNTCKKMKIININRSEFNVPVSYLFNWSSATTFQFQLQVNILESSGNYLVVSIDSPGVFI
jgi:hypothetical protein